MVKFIMIWAIATGGAITSGQTEFGIAGECYAARDLLALNAKNAGFQFVGTCHSSTSGAAAIPPSWWGGNTGKQ